jgi:hypothetical protein
MIKFDPEENEENRSWLGKLAVKLGVPINTYYYRRIIRKRQDKDGTINIPKKGEVIGKTPKITVVEVKKRTKAGNDVITYEKTDLTWRKNRKYWWE